MVPSEVTRNQKDTLFVLSSYANLSLWLYLVCAFNLKKEYLQTYSAHTYVQAKHVYIQNKTNVKFYVLLKVI